MHANARITYTGGTPGADANTYTIVNTDSMEGLTPAHAGLSWVAVDIAHDAAGTINWYKKVGSGWRQVGTEAIAAPPANTSTRRDFNIEPLRGFRLEWVNGGAAQTFFDVDAVLVAHDRSSV